MNQTKTLFFVHPCDTYIAVVNIEPENSNHARNNLFTYRKVSDIRRTLVGNNILDHSDVVGASPVDAVPATSSFST